MLEDWDSAMRILIHVIFNNVVKSVPPRHCALDFFKGRDHYLDMDGWFKASVKEKTWSIFHRKDRQAKVCHW